MISSKGEYFTLKLNFRRSWWNPYFFLQNFTDYYGSRPAKQVHGWLAEKVRRNQKCFCKHPTGASAQNTEPRRHRNYFFNDGERYPLGHCHNRRDLWGELRAFHELKCEKHKFAYRFVRWNITFLLGIRSVLSGRIL